MTRLARPATLLEAYRIRSLDLSPVGGGATLLEYAVLPKPIDTMLALTVAGGSHRLFVVAHNRRLEGLVHVVCRSRSRRWDVLRATPDADGLWLCDALQSVTEYAAATDMTRITATVLRDDDRLHAFEESGFRPYAKEMVFAATIDELVRDSAEIEFRQCHSDDEWRLQRLYSLVTPAPVRLTDAVTAREFLHPFLRGANVVIEAEGEVLAVAGSDRPHGSRAALVRLLVRPNHAGAGRAALQRLAVLLAEKGVREIWLPVREYMGDCQAAARLVGCSLEAERLVMVKHTAALVRRPVFSRAREVVGTVSAVNGSRLVHSGCHVPRCTLRNDLHPRRRASSMSAA